MKHRLCLALAAMALGCGGSHANDLPPGVSTAPRTLPPPPPAPDDAGAGDAGAVAEPEAPPPPQRYRLVARTGMSKSGKAIDPKKIIERIEQKPGMLQTCAPFAAREPNAPDGTWNVELTLKGKKVELDLQSPVSESFELCMQDAAATWDLSGLGSGSMMLLFGLAPE